jgi:uncharacterized membrane protein YgdD (TMEM256/DUF423 family)
MSLVELRERLLDSPERARSLLTVRAAISSARLSLRPCLFSDSFTCLYCRSRLLPLLTPLGGIGLTSLRGRLGLSSALPARRDHYAGER